MSIEVPEELESRLRELAAARGLSIDAFVTTELERLVASTPVRTLRGKGVLHAGPDAPRARDLKQHLIDEAGRA
ncbi:hypothetical protein [Streptacidiphilus sp. EB129]|jgi:hypothetical protein|uniref:hypothetical protein n=1 Tax=Streptacidiphilus sp. EB129 TaxID=3156262 RepID=UPI003519A5A5